MIRNTLLLIALLHLALAPTARAQRPALRDALRGAFLVGAALGRAQIFETDARTNELVATHFNSITPENALKWAALQPAENRFDFAAADRFVALGERRGMFVVGHTLVWHNQTPTWVFEDEKGRPVGRRRLLARMRAHIRRVVGRYRGRIKGWDVVNEALAEDGSLRRSKWLEIIGEDYVAKAFEFAREADPSAELYYNDYSLENEPKRRGAVRLIESLLARGIKVTAVGLQGHYSLAFPRPEQLERAIGGFAALGVKVAITELDVDVLPSPGSDAGDAETTRKYAADPRLDPYRNGLPAEVEKELAARYAALFEIFLRHRRSIARVTFWGVTDAGSWKNDFPVRGRTNYPLLFDRAGKPKPAFDAVIETARAALSSSK